MFQLDKTDCKNIILNMLNLLPHPNWKLFLKRMIDIVVSIIVLLFIWPVFILVIILIKITSPGPILYKGIREGYGWKPFRMYKFRTMVENAEMIGGTTTGKNDRRVTWIGHYLRRSKIDELPQFFNVLKGDMSLVGPRPEVLEYTNQYIGEERLILCMKPGITDFSSIEFSNLDDIVGNDDPDKYFQEYVLPKKNKLRIKYVKEWKLSTDIYILYETIFRIISNIFSK